MTRNYVTVICTAAALTGCGSVEGKLLSAEEVVPMSIAQPRIYHLEIQTDDSTYRCSTTDPQGYRFVRGEHPLGKTVSINRFWWGCQEL